VFDFKLIVYIRDSGDYLFKVIYKFCYLRMGIIVIVNNLQYIYHYLLFNFLLVIVQLNSRKSFHFLPKDFYKSFIYSINKN
jgi:hypothetical protein